MDSIKKSIHIIKNLQLPNGGILATSSDGAYPYIYPRDAVIITKALNCVGLGKRSEKFYKFMNKHSKLHQYEEIFHRYNKNGLPCVTRKHQHDNTGLVLEGIYNTYLHTKNTRFLEEMWHLIEQCSRFIFKISKSGLVDTETSIHELYRLENGFELWANCACCRGLYDAAEIAKILGHRKESQEWEKKASQIKKNIEKKMFNRKTGLFMKIKKYPNITDISQIAPFYFRLCKSRQILRRTVNHLKKTLWHADVGGFRRFKKFEICKDWHWYSGGSGGWVSYTPWIAHFYKELGDRKNFNMCQKWMEKTADMSDGLLPEHIATKKEYDEWKSHEIEFNHRILRAMKKSEELNKKIKRKYKQDLVYWAFPLGWSHAEYLLLNRGCV